MLGNLYSVQGAKQLESTQNEILIRKLLHERQNCRECSKIWCSFSKQILNSYVPLMKKLDYVKMDDFDTYYINADGN